MAAERSEDATGDFEFSYYVFWRWLILGFFAVASVIAVVLIVVAAREGKNSPVEFVLLWIAAGVWNGYWFLFRIAHRVQVIGGEFRWQAPLARGAVPIDAVKSARPSLLGSNVEVFEIEGRPGVQIFIRFGLDEFLRQLHLRRPDVRTRVGWQGRFAQSTWMPGGDGFRPL